MTRPPMTTDRTTTLAARRPYVAPSVTRVHIDPVRELLQQTGCARNPGENQTCNNNPCTGGGGV